MRDAQNKCYFPTDSAIPTKFDLKIAQWLSRKIHDVSEVIVVIGKSEKGQLTPSQKSDVWRTYLNDNRFAPIYLHVDEEHSPLTAVYKMHERLPKDAFTLALPENVAKNETFQSHFEVFPNYDIIIVPKYDKQASVQMLAALEAGDFREFSKYLPGELPLSDKQAIFDSLKTKEPALNEVYWNGMINDLYTQYGLK